MKVLTIRIPVSVYSSLCNQAGESGVTVSAHARRLIEKEHDAESILDLRDELISKIEGLMPSTKQANDKLEVFEMLLLLRELAADRNPQILQRVRMKVNEKQNLQERN